MIECLQSQRAFKSYYGGKPIKFIIILITVIVLFVMFLSYMAQIKTITDIAKKKEEGLLITKTAGWIDKGFRCFGIQSNMKQKRIDAAVKKAKQEHNNMIPVLFVGISLIPILYFSLKGKSKCFQKGSGLDSLARVVGEIIFLPMFAKINKFLETNKNAESFAKEFAFEKICEWGYKKEFAEMLIEQNIGKKSSDTLLNEFNLIIKEINCLQKEELYKNVCTKRELPIQKIKNIAENIKNEVPCGKI
jgi:hypothetical protein